MQTKYTYKQIWLIAYPILISLLMEQLIGMTDTAFLGRVGEVELGASAIAGVFYMVIFMVAFGFSIGAQILIARRNGEQQYKEIGDLFYQGIYFQVGMATVMFLLSYCFSPIILKRIVASEHIYEAATSYLHWRVFGAFFSFSAVMFRAFFLGTTQTKTLTLNSIVMVLSNVVFNYILIFGKFGFPALGIAGAAIGSSLAELVSLLFFILYTRSRIDCCKYGLDRIPKFRLDVLKRMLNVSFWTMIQNFFSLSTWFLFFLYVEHLGERSLAVTNIVRNVSGILFMVLMAFASTCGSLVSNLIGAGHSDCVAGTIRQHVRIAYVFVLPLALLFALFPQADSGNLYRHTRPAGRCRAFALGDVLHLSVPGSCQCLFPGSFRNRQYAYCIGHGAGNAGHLHSLYHLHYSDSATRRGHLLDLGNGLFQLYSHFLLAIYQTWELARKENLVSLH